MVLFCIMYELVYLYTNSSCYNHLTLMKTRMKTYDENDLMYSDRTQCLLNALIMHFTILQYTIVHFSTEITQMKVAYSALNLRDKNNLHFSW